MLSLAPAQVVGAPPLDELPPPHAVVQLAERQSERAASDALVSQEAGGVLVPRHTVQPGSLSQASAWLQHEASRQALHVGSLDERPHPEPPLLVEPLDPPLELVFTGKPEELLELELELEVVITVAPPPAPLPPPSVKVKPFAQETATGRSTKGRSV
jgi:hypothetical protein